jgi:acetyl-CoA carboxylase biotin carboxylase subunit
LNAEDPSRDFAPFPGTVSALRVPGGPGVRFESMLYAGYTVPPFYDSLLAKLVVHAETREAAITRLVRALSETRIDGLRTTKPLVSGTGRRSVGAGQCRSHPLAGRLA